MVPCGQRAKTGRWPEQYSTSNQCTSSSTARTPRLSWSVRLRNWSFVRSTASPDCIHTQLAVAPCLHSRHNQRRSRCPACTRTAQHTYHPLDPPEVLLKVLVAVAISVSQRNGAVVRSQQGRVTEWQASSELSLVFTPSMSYKGCLAISKHKVNQAGAIRLRDSMMNLTCVCMALCSHGSTTTVPLSHTSVQMPPESHLEGYQCTSFSPVVSFHHVESAHTQ